VDQGIGKQDLAVGFPLFMIQGAADQGRHHLEAPGPLQQAPIHLRAIVSFEHPKPPENPTRGIRVWASLRVPQMTAAIETET
jgi:hypothetical protein